MKGGKVFTHREIISGSSFGGGGGESGGSCNN